MNWIPALNISTLKTDPRWRKWIPIGLAVFVLGAATVLVAAAWNRAPDDAGRPHSGDSRLPPSSLQSLLDNSKSSLLGHIVFLNDVQLQKGPAPHLFFVVGSDGNRMLARSADSKLSAAPRVPVDVMGTIRSLPSAWAMRHEWKLSSVEAKRMAKQKIFLEAQEIEPQDSN